MKRLQTFLLIVALVLAPAACPALDPGKGIKVTPILKTTESWDGKPLAYPQGQAEITGMIIEIAEGAETGWHLHPVPSFGMVLQGNLTVFLKDGSKKVLKEGDSIAEVVNTLHNGKNTGTGPVKLIVFYAGAQGGKLTVRETDAEAGKGSAQ